MKGIALITGASGFIGRRLAPGLRKKHRELEIDCLTWSESNDHDLRGCQELQKFSLTPRPADLVTRRGLEALHPKYNIVFHLASTTDTRDKRAPCNYEGTKNLLESLRDFGPGCHFLFTSSVAVNDWRPSYDVPVDENTPIYQTPSIAYARTKLLAEEYLKAEAIKRGFSLTIVRFVTVYGEGPRPNSLFQVLKDQVRRQTLWTRLNWPGRTDLIHVDDAAEALIRLAESPPPAGETNVWVLKGETTTLPQLSKAIYSELGISYQPINLPAIFWKAVSQFSQAKSWMRYFFPSGLFSQIWRATLSAESVIWTNDSKFRERFPDFRFKAFCDAPGEALTES
jgi:nucleoside-diphosphate-sugar epimerase